MVAVSPEKMTELTLVMGRAQRAYKKWESAVDPTHKAFHKGRVEAYLQWAAEVAGTSVKAIRKPVLGSKSKL